MTKPTMKHCRLIILASIFSALTGCGSDSQSLVLGTNGVINRISISDSSDPVIQKAANELSRYIGQITGKFLPVTIDKELSDTSTGILRLQKTNDDSIRWDGFSIRVRSHRVDLNAKESRGFLYAAYTFLEQAGCSFFYPGTKEQVVPKKATLTFAQGVFIHNPILEHRGLAPYGLDRNSIEAGRDFIDWMAKNKFNYILVSENRPSDSDGPANGSVWKEVTKELLPELQQRGFIIEMSEHCTPVFFPRTLHKQHPEWFALNDGVRKLGPPPYSGQMCYSNRDAVEYYGNALADYAGKHPEFSVIGTWPLDGGRYCECEQCKDPNTYFNASKRVAEIVKKVRPDITVEYLAYNDQFTAPKMDRLPANMSVLWCADPGIMRDTLQQWVKKANKAGGVELFEYFFGDNYRAGTNVWLRPKYATKMPELARTEGFRGVVSLFLPIQSWWRSAFNSSFFAKACWDKSLNVDSTLERYFAAYYPQHSTEIDSVFSTIFLHFQEEPYQVCGTLSPPKIRHLDSTAGEVVGRLDQLFNNTSDSTERTRIGRIRTYVEFSKLYRDAFASGNPADLDSLVRYSQLRPEQHMVLMYPGYIRWRLEEYFEAFSQKAVKSNPPYRPNKVFEGFENLNSPKFADLQKKYRIDTVFHGEKDEFRRILLLRQWVRKLIRIDNAGPYPDDGSVESILDEAIKGHGFHCGHYMAVMNAVLNSYGYVTRCLRADVGVPVDFVESEGHHAVNEVWVNSYRKWVIIDAKYDMHFEKQGIPLSAMEVRAEYLRNKAADLIIVAGPDRKRKDVFPELKNRNVERFARIYTWLSWDKQGNRYTNFSNTNTDFLIMYGDQYFKSHTWLFNGKKHWAYGTPYMTVVSDPEAVDWTPNTIKSTVTVANDQASIKLESSTPNLSAYEMRRNDDSDWVKVKDTARVSLRGFSDSVYFRAVNARGIAGPPHLVWVSRGN